MPRKIVEVIDVLIQQGYFKNRSEALIDAARHFVRSMNLPSEIGSFVQDGLRRRVPRQKVDETEFAHLWRKVRTGTEWQDRYGKTPEEVMAEEVTMKPPCKISSLLRDGLHKRATSQEVVEEELVHLWEK